MASGIALVLCTILVLFLLRLERKQAPDVSYASWVPTIWLLLIASKPLAYWFGTGSVDPDAGSPLDRSVHTGLILLGVIILVNKGFVWSDGIRENPWMAALIGYMFISILWSDVSFIALKQWVRQLAAIVMAFLIATEPEPRRAIQCLFRRTIYILIPFSYMVIHYYPHLGRQYGRWSGALMWTGVASQKNGLGRLCFFAAFFLIWTLVRRWKGRDVAAIWYQTYVEVGLLMLTFVLFMGPQRSLTYSATSTAALAAGVAFFVGLSWMRKNGKTIRASALTIITAAVIGYGIATPFVGGLSILDISSALGREETLTGRSDIWALLVPYALQRPIVGYGLGGFSAEAMFRISPHNGFLSVILSFGFVGVFFFSAFLLSSARRAQREMLRDFDWGVLWACFLIMAVVHNIAESTIVSLSTHLVAVILFFYIGSWRDQSVKKGVKEMRV